MCLYVFVCVCLGEHVWVCDMCDKHTLSNCTELALNIPKRSPSERTKCYPKQRKLMTEVLVRERTERAEGSAASVTAFHADVEGEIRLIFQLKAQLSYITAMAFVCIQF